jgi:hypothetical protein
MKKFIKSLIAIMCAMVLFSAPSVTASAASASSVPALVLDVEGIRVYEYQPEPFFLEAGYSTQIKDTTTSDGWFKVPAGKKLSIRLYFDDNSNQYYNVLIRSKTLGTILYTGVQSEKYPLFECPVQSYDDDFPINVYAVTNNYILRYSTTLY